MSLSDPYVMKSVHSDGSADFTISIDDDDHKFSASQLGAEAIVEYEETLSWRGEIRVSEPHEQVWKLLMQSEEMTEWLDANDLVAIRRET